MTDSPAGQSPLDVLDQILNEAKEKADQTVAAKAEAAAAEAEAERARQKAEDAQKIAEELAALEGVKQSPQYQAAVEQKHEEEVEKKQHGEKMQGMEIHQLVHDTV